MKKCPFCAEEILDAAIKCKHCGSDISNLEVNNLNEVKADLNIEPKASNPQNAPIDESKEKVWTILAHLGGLIPITFMSVLIPLLIWLLVGKDSAFIERQSKEALNFQISLVIYQVGAFLIAFTIIGIPLTFVAIFLLCVTNFICSIYAAIQVSKKNTYSYPINLHLIR